VSTSSTARNFGAIETAAAFSKSVGRLVRISTARDAMFLDINDGDSSDNACDSFFAPAESNCRSHFFRELPAHWCSTAASVVASSLTFPSSEVVLVEEAEVYQAEAFLLFYKVSGSQGERDASRTRNATNRQSQSNWAAKLLRPSFLAVASWRVGVSA